MTPTAFLVAALVLSAAVGMAAAQPADRMTICHKADGQPRTIEVARSAWKAHQGHGDTEGACGAAGKAPAPRPAPPPPPTQLGLAMRGDGDLDGEAVFRLDIEHGANDAVALVVSGQLKGEGRWDVQAPGATCQVERAAFECRLATLADGDDYRLEVRLDGPPVTVCREASVTATLRAANDATSGDDRAAERVLLGACSPLDH